MKSRIENALGRGFGATIAPGVLAMLMASWTPVCLAAQPDQTTFPSAEAGSRALFLAVRNHDEQTLTKILGSGEELVSSDDAAQDKLDRQQFIQKYQEMHRLTRDPDGDTILYIGAENWPFPIPLVAKDGVWRFDAAAGQQEVLLRRIGENETTAIEVCHALFLAEKPMATGEKPDSAIAALLAELEGSKNPVLFQAYEFRILAGTDKHTPGEAGRQIHDDGPTQAATVIAYPSAYRSSGVMSFITGRDGVVYQKDLGPDTAQVAAAMTASQRDPSWAPVPAEP